MTIKLIVGLANPGKKYITTRHNIGAWYVHALVKNYFGFFNINKKFHGYTSVLNFNKKIIHILIPTTFMNLSGIAVLKISSFYNLNLEEILIAHDDVHLLPGKIKLKFGGNHGGHNGLKNIISCFNCNNFYRLRIGIGYPDDKETLIQFVLNIPSIQDQELIKNSIQASFKNLAILINQNNMQKKEIIEIYNSISFS